MPSCLALKQNKSTNQTNSKTKQKRKKNTHRFCGSNSGSHNLTPSTLLAELPTQPIYPLPPQPGSKPRSRRFKTCFTELRPSYGSVHHPLELFWGGSLKAHSDQYSCQAFWQRATNDKWMGYDYCCSSLFCLFLCFVESHDVDFTAAVHELGCSCLGLLSAGLQMRSHPAHLQGYIVSFEHTVFWCSWHAVTWGWGA